MRILSITAQKPHSTGSGVYLTELVRSFARCGCEQAVVAGVYKEDVVDFPSGVEFYSVYFDSEELDMPIVGMSDEMPYKSIAYNQLKEEQVLQFEQTFLDKITAVVQQFQPDILLCHHLYLLTANVRKAFPELKVFGICHGSDLRQIKKTDLKQTFIKHHISQLNGIFALHEQQAEEICSIYHYQRNQVKVVGAGYNDQIFRLMPRTVKQQPITLVFAGKIAAKKGVVSLLRSMDYFPYQPEELCLKLAGGAGNQEEYAGIEQLAADCRYPVTFLGRLNQEELAAVFNQALVFVLPSYYEGLPLVIIEALGCGLKVVATDLPGIREWMDAHVPGNNITYVTPPPMHNTDEPSEENLPKFEKELAEAIVRSISAKAAAAADLSGVTWNGIGRAILDCFTE